MNEANEITNEITNEAIEMNEMYEKCKDRLAYKNEIIKQFTEAGAIDAISRIERIFKDDESRCPCYGSATFTATTEAPSLNDAFIWSETKDGFNYWSDVESFLDGSQD